MINLFLYNRKNNFILKKISKTVSNIYLKKANKIFNNFKIKKN